MSKIAKIAMSMAMLAQDVFGIGGKSSGTFIARNDGYLQLEKAKGKRTAKEKAKERMQCASRKANRRNK